MINKENIEAVSVVDNPEEWTFTDRMKFLRWADEHMPNDSEEVRAKHADAVLRDVLVRHG